MHVHTPEFVLAHDCTHTHTHTPTQTPLPTKIQNAHTHPHTPTHAHIHKTLIAHPNLGIHGYSRNVEKQEGTTTSLLAEHKQSGSYGAYLIQDWMETE